MNLESLSLFLDILILLGLVTTIYFALRLSNSLNNFRKQRRDFEKLMRHLNHNIEQAHVSLANMKTAGGYDEDIQGSLHEARTLLDELHLMNETGNNLADRLERLASKSRVAQSPDSVAPHVAINDFDFDDVGSESDHDYDTHLYNNIARMERAERPDVAGGDGFSIQDREFSDDAPAPAGASQAERELMQALMRNQTRSAG